MVILSIFREVTGDKKKAKMWWESIPAAAIIVVAMYIPPQIIHYSNKYLVFGTPCRKQVISYWQALHYRRDEYIGKGDAYNIQGLENIPEK